MEVQPDFRELLKLFNEYQVEYMIVGGYALAFHGVPRFTGDIDLLVRPSSNNAEKIMQVLTAFGFGDIGLSKKDFQIPDQVVQLGVPPVRIDIMTSISGVEMDEAFANCVDGQYGDVPVKFIGRDQFVQNKRSSGRKRDQSDLESLGEEE